MSNKILTALAILTAGATLAVAVPASATPLHRTVQCADGTIFKKVGDQVTDAQVCANHGGVSRGRVIVPNGIQTNHGIPPIEDKTRPSKKRASR